MSVGSEQEIVGQYLVTWNSLALGLFEGEQGSPALTQDPQSKPIASSDRWGQSKIDGVWLGVNWTFDAVMMEYPKAVTGALNPFATLGYLGTIGSLKWAAAKPLVMTVVAGTPAVGSPNTVTATRAILADNFQSKMFFGPQLRTVPLRMDLLPFLDGSNLATCFTMT